MRKIVNNPYFQSITGGLLMSLAWWEHFTGLIMMLAFVPSLNILYVARNEKVSGSKVFTSLLPGFLLFNIISFSWLGNVSAAGAAMAILAHSFLMSFTLWLVYLVSLKAKKITTVLSFISFWMAYEYLCLNLTIISPWLNTGNVFGKEPGLIQWYEFTGAGGGTLWILLTNVVIFVGIARSIKNRKLSLKHLWAGIGLIITPIVLSFITGWSFDEVSPAERVIIVQPNIDPYTEKFDRLSFSYQLDEMLEMAAEHIDSSTKWLILPETAIDDPFDESVADTNRYIRRLKDFLAGYDSLNIIIGATTEREYYGDAGSDRTSSIKNKASSAPNELFNSAVHLDNNDEVSFYHKSKLVPGIEQKVAILPPFLERIIIPELGGSMSGYGVQDERDVFTHTFSGSKAAPLICYESAFGEFTTGFIQEGADFIALITNDGWWINTVGYKQHLWFASLRAIETRRPVVRSANTGISCVIDKRGRIIESLPWWEKGVLVADIYPGQEITTYSSSGDLLYRYLSFCGILILILAFVAAPLRKKNNIT